MARTQSIGDDDLIMRLGTVFRSTGFEGASLSMLSRASGLQKASLYHRFPEGKQQMAAEVLAFAGAWLQVHVIAPLKGDAPPRDRLNTVSHHLDRFYEGGRLACLLNVMAGPGQAGGPFAPAIREALAALIDAFSQVARDAGHDAATASRLAERAVMLIQGSLVIAIGMNDPSPFRRALDSLSDELLPPAEGA